MSSVINSGEGDLSAGKDILIDREGAKTENKVSRCVHFKDQIECRYYSPDSPSNKYRTTQYRTIQSPKVRVRAQPTKRLPSMLKLLVALVLVGVVISILLLVIL